MMRKTITAIFLIITVAFFVFIGYMLYWRGFNDGSFYVLQRIYQEKK